MSKTFVLLALILLLSAASCDRAQPEPLTLPYVLYEQEHYGNQVTITLDSACQMALQPDQYCFQIAVLPGADQSTVGVHIIAVPLTEGYRRGVDIDWEERVGDQQGSGALWEGSNPPGTALQTKVALGLAGQANDPVALFVRVTGTLQGNVATQLQWEPPLAVLQILPDGGGVVRLDR